MSYEIVKERKFIKVGEKYLPLCYHSSNNAWDQGVNGRHRRAHYWSTIYFGERFLGLATEKEILDSLECYVNDVETEHFKWRSKWIKGKQIIGFFKRGMTDALDLDKDEAYLKIQFINEKQRELILKRDKVASTKELKEVLDIYFKQKVLKDIYVDIVLVVNGKVVS